MEQFKALLKEAGYSSTKVRLAVFNALLGCEPLSMAELVRKVPEVDRASVYRAVNLFEQLGVVQRINIGWKYKLELTDRFAAHHHHLSCINCGRTIEMSEAELEQLIHSLAKAHNFAPTAHQIEIQGLCADCRGAN
ncbi:transcriptional repressor [Candidatus Saccharibacteria bacterium]|nr:transcriptional repressor [Candidatus Saccharibacteria bacterium]